MTFNIDLRYRHIFFSRPESIIPRQRVLDGVATFVDAQSDPVIFWSQCIGSEVKMRRVIDE